MSVGQVGPTTRLQGWQADAAPAPASPSWQPAPAMPADQASWTVGLAPAAPNGALADPAYGVAPAYAPQPGALAQPAYAPQPASAPQPAYTPQPIYVQPGYAPAQSHAPAPGYAVAPSFAPAAVDAYVPPPAYAPAPAAPAAHPTAEPVFGDVNAPAPVQAPSPVAPAPVAPAPAPARPAPVAHQPRRGALDARAAFAKADANDSGKLSRGELKALKAEDARRHGRDGSVTWGEFARAWLGARSFKALDRDRDGALRAGEIDRLVTKGAAYDRNHDGAITKREFLAGRRQDQPAPKATKAQQQRVARLFDLADLDLDGSLRGGERQAYRAYDRNRNGRISEREFRQGQARDRKAAREGAWLEGRVGPNVAKRLRTDAFGKNKAMPKPQIRLDAKRVAALLGSPEANVRRSLPGIVAALNKAGIKDKNAFVAMLATIRTEAGNFLPIHEYGGPSYWANYNARRDLGNRPGTNDGVVYHGRGFIQLTGRGNYRTYGNAIGVDLVRRPDRALDPKIAARILVSYFNARGIVSRARAGDWAGVRTGVNGGYNGWDTFIGAVRKLKGDNAWFRKV